MHLPKRKLLYCYFELARNKLSYIAKLLGAKKQLNNVTIKQFNNGFTLIELLIVISIIAILVASATYSWQNAQQKGRDGKRKSDVKAVQQALEFYFQNNGKYPDSSSGQIKCNISGDTLNKDWGTSFNCGSINYMQQLPKDPTYQTTDGYYYYAVSANPTTYQLWAKIENTRDPELSSLPPVCGGLVCSPPAAAASRNYYVVNP